MQHKSKMGIRETKQAQLLLKNKANLKEFFYYWTEKSDNGKKMRFELSKNQPFNTARRLTTWKKNENKFGTPKTTTEDRQAINRELFNEAIKN